MIFRAQCALGMLDWWESSVPILEGFDEYPSEDSVCHDRPDRFPHHADQSPLSEL